MYNARLLLDLLLTAATLSTPLFGASSAHEKAEAPKAPRVAAALARKAVRPAAPEFVKSSLTYTVTATVYEAVPAQTDDEPFVTADNSRIKPHYGSKKRWMALSRDLLEPWGGEFKYGDTVRVTGLSPKLDGVYTVHDTMNRRHKHCMDVLVHPSEKLDVFCKGVKIHKVTRPSYAVLD